MTPILAEFGGAFVYGFVVGKTLIGEPAINRVFMIAFPDRGTRTRFFAEPRYREIREEFYAPAVVSATVLAEFDG